jgi:hypothetical protein
LPLGAVPAAGRGVSCGEVLAATRWACLEPSTLGNTWVVLLAPPWLVGFCCIVRAESVPACRGCAGSGRTVDALRTGVSFGPGLG